MKETKFKTKEGQEGVNYSLEDGDEVVSRFSEVGTRQNPAIVNGKAVIINNHFLGVTTKEGKEVTLKITEGQKKVLDKEGDLTGKTILGRKYTNDYGDQIGASVKKE